MSDVEKARVTRQVGIGKASVSDSLLTCRNWLDGIKTGVCPISRDELGGCPFIGQAVSGMEATRARSAASAWNVRRPDPILPVWLCVQWARGSSPGVCWGVSTVAGSAGGPARSSDEALVMGVEPRDRVICDCVRWINQNPLGFGRSRVNELKSPDKPFEISKWAVMEAWEKVKANKGAPGVDGVSIEEFEADLKNNLYKVWNRMSSGSCFAPPVRGGGDTEAAWRGYQDAWYAYRGRPGGANGGGYGIGEKSRADLPRRFLWLPAGSLAVGRGGQMPAAMLEDRLGDRFGHPKIFRQRFLGPDAQGGGGTHRSAVGDAVCEPVAAAPVQLPDGTLQQRDRGTPQGSPVSPVLANLFLHYAFDVWMAREFPTVRFERYVDDAVIHCVSERQARQVLAALQTGWSRSGCGCIPTRPGSCTARIGKRRGSHEHTSFTFLGFTFRQRAARNKHGQMFSSFLARDQQGRLETRSAGRCGRGDCTTAPACPSPSSHDGSIPLCGAGCSTTARSTARRCIHS